MENFLGIVLIIILSFYLLKWVLRLILPFLIKKLVKKMGEKAFGSGFDFSSNFENFDSSNEGNVTVTHRQQNPKNKTADKGEYVDFEEVK